MKTLNKSWGSSVDTISPNRPSTFYRFDYEASVPTISIKVNRGDYFKQDKLGLHLNSLALFMKEGGVESGIQAMFWISILELFAPLIGRFSRGSIFSVGAVKDIRFFGWLLIGSFVANLFFILLQWQSMNPLRQVDAGLYIALFILVFADTLNKSRKSETIRKNLEREAELTI